MWQSLLCIPRTSTADFAAKAWPTQHPIHMRILRMEGGTVELLMALWHMHTAGRTHVQCPGPGPPRPLQGCWECKAAPLGPRRVK